MIADNNPERRNLTVLSLAIIIFYLAGGKVTNDDLHLEVVNITFHNHHMLGVIVWVMLGWFLFRYWVTNKDTHGDLLFNSPHTANLNYSYVRKYVANKREPQFGHLEKVEKNLPMAGVYFQWGMWLLSAGQRGERSSGDAVLLDGVVGYLIRIHYFVRILFHHRAASDYYLPYALFYLAVFLGLKHSSILMNVWDFIPLLLLFIVQYVYETRQISSVGSRPDGRGKYQITSM